MKKVLKKISVFFTGLIIALIILEICLRIIGYIHIKNASSDLHKQNKSDFTILTIGDSFTEGVGATKGKDYPTQLQQLLNSKTNKTFKVVNGGQSGQNTAQVLNKLQSQINIAKPNLIILLAGQANRWNLWGYNNYTNNLLYRIRVYKFIKLLYLNIKDKKMYNNEFSSENEKAIKQFKNDIKTNPENGKNYYNIGGYYLYIKKDYHQAIKWFEKGIKTDCKEPANYKGLYYAYNCLDEKELSVKWVKQKIEEDPSNINLWNLLTKKNIQQYQSNWIIKEINVLKQNIKTNPDIFDNYIAANTAYNLINKNKESIIWAKHELEKNPDNFILYYGIGNIYKTSGDSANAHKWFLKTINVFEKSIKTNQKNYNNYTNIIYTKLISHDDEFINWFKQKNINKKQNIIDNEDKINKINTQNGPLVISWVTSDIKKVIKICQTQKIKLIIQNYPMRYGYNDAISENQTLENIAQKYSIPFVDNNQTFYQLGETQDKFFQPKNQGTHCNANGYNLMAQNIYNKIIKENIFNIKN